MTSNITEIRAASRAIYLVCEELVAKDISEKLTWAADKIEELEKQATDMGWELSPDRMGQ